MYSVKLRTVRLLLPGLAGVSLMLSSGCGVIPISHREPDHVFSSAIPQKSEVQPSNSSARVTAHYPDTLSYNTMPDPTDSVIRMTVKPRLIDGNVENSAIYPTSDSDADAVAARKQTVNQIQLVSFQTDESDAAKSEHLPHFIPSEPRLPFDPREVPSNCMETIAASPLADMFPDEYIFDGGDRNAPAGYVDGQRSGFDTEDTVAKFKDHTGDARTSPSNRVAVYAPRFGSVRTVTSLLADTKVDKAAGARDALAVGNVRTGNAAQENVHDTVLSGLESRHRVDGIAAASPPMQARSTDSVEQNRKVDEGHEGRHYSSSSSMHRNEGFVLQQQIQNAISWTRDEYPVLTASTMSASKIKATLKVQQTVGLEDERKTKGNIHVVKLADREMAQSGDTITFTIRFQNTGDFDVYDVSIVDNLTPRLDYLAGTAKIDGEHPGEVVIEDNGEGSKVLTFNLDNALKGHDHGEITFEARVR
ncbi:MAG: DUF11 domain-containing protein [Planctomycetota bacterium]|nr:DUF11 domain-containing protein [Planctomycetota bacterium]